MLLPRETLESEKGADGDQAGRSSVSTQKCPGEGGPKVTAHPEKSRHKDDHRKQAKIQEEGSDQQR